MPCILILQRSYNWNLNVCDNLRGYLVQKLGHFGNQLHHRTHLPKEINGRKQTTQKSEWFFSQSCNPTKSRGWQMQSQPTYTEGDQTGNHQPRAAKDSRGQATHNWSISHQRLWESKGNTTESPPYPRTWNSNPLASPPKNEVSTSAITHSANTTKS